MFIHNVELIIVTQCVCSTTTNQRRPLLTHDIWKFQAKLPHSYWYPPWKFKPLLMISARC